MSDQTARQLAERVRDTMFAHDAAAHALGLTIAAVDCGSATVAMTVRADMVNGHALCHGGLISTLADTAFAYACNSGNQMTVASGFAIDFVAPARLGDVLSAAATEQFRAGLTGVYDVRVSNQRGELIALFRGRSHTFKGKPAIPA